MSMHKKPLSENEEAGLRAHGLNVGTPSQLSDVFRQGMAWQASSQRVIAEQGELIELLRKIHGDMLMRGERDSDGVTVVNLSSSIWNRLSITLDKHKGITQ